MAEVFLAQQRGLEGFDRRVAVKRILPHLADSQDFVRMFLGEAKLAAQLSHPNIVHIYEFGKVAGDFFIAMEYVEGVHAGELFNAGSGADRLSPTLVARIGADAAAALHSAHELRGPNGKSLGLVHRDVSPANIMISYDGIVKLCDFGIAKAAAATDQLTSPGQVKGKYAYMSPEQTIATPLDGRSDVFSLSIVLWELLAGKYMVPRGDAVTAMRMIRDGKIEALAAVAPDVPPALVKAITWGLETKRENRATASELAQALEAFIKQSPEIATPLQLGNWVRTQIPRERTSEHPAPAPGAGTQVAPGTVASPQTDASSSSNQAVTPDPDRVRRKDLIGASLLAAEATGAGTREVLLEESFETRVLDKPPRGAFEAKTSKPFAAPATTNTMAATHEVIDLVDDATTIDKPFPPLNNSGITPRPVHGADAPTQIATHMPGILDEDDEHSDASETVLLDRPNPMPQAPRLGPVVPTEFGSPLSGPRVRVSEPLPPSGAMQPLPGPRSSSTFLTPWRARQPMAGGSPEQHDQHEHSKQMRVAITIAALVGIALISFVIALAASGHHTRVGSAPLTSPSPSPLTSKGSTATVVMVEHDAGAGSAVMVAAKPVTIDAAALAATLDAATAHEAHLEIETFPTGGKVRLGNQVRTAPAQIVVEAGTFEVTGELAGYQPETRPVTIAPGEHVKLELTFDHKLATNHPTTLMGRLTARTTPYSEVFENGKKIGETPFEREMTVGPHVLVFRNPLHPAMTRRVVITAGKLAKVNEKLGD